MPHSKAISKITHNRIGSITATATALKIEVFNLAADAAFEFKDFEDPKECKANFTKKGKLKAKYTNRAKKAKKIRLRALKLSAAMTKVLDCIEDVKKLID